ncbi:hypothetical protein GCM10007424_23480 [Flavobacterium suaedae]|uniref:Transmembrane Fragile-X-F protein n=1 Tax=Flavobacterium suaedae TaxID=1767027 RepID=A0ABQ1JZ56_9FLAO|nr:hypothetical protein [Flavobacterium suaedae]GGB82747.1 hypothetical protein GCM10007424_23480 [Flavobacterium suaedae]
MSKATSVVSIDFLGLLTIVFIILKLTNVINWSWWWVTSPLWLPIAGVLVAGIIGFLIALIFSK